MSTDGYIAEPPPGQSRLGSDAPNRQLELIGVGVTTTAIAIVTVGLRLFTRLRIVRGRVSKDDYFVVAALVFSIASLTASLKQTDYGLSFHKWEILFTKFNIGYPVTDIISTCSYAISIMFSKLSILYFYLRLSPHNWFRICTYTLVTASITYSTAYVFINIFPCQPIQATWDYTVPKSTCIDPWAAYYALSVLNIIMDCFTLILPVPIVLPLQMERRQKASLLLLFTTGAIVCAIAISRTTLIAFFQASHDRSWDVVDDYLLSYPEMNGGIICASVPALKPLFMSLLQGRLKSFSSRSSPRRHGRYHDGGSSYFKRSYGFNTMAKQERAWRKMQRNQSLPLGSVEDTSHGDSGDKSAHTHYNKHPRNAPMTLKMTTMPPGTSPYYYEDDDDEVIQLWRLDRRDRHQDPGFEKAVLVGMRPIASLSSPSAEELRGDGAVHDARAMAASPKSVKNSGIMVTRETRIQYETEW